jgi:hypothetical protein
MKTETTMSDKPWNEKVPSKGKSMSSSQVKSAKARARAAGRPYPNLVDNMAAMKEEEVDEACWDGYKKVGMKKKGARMVPNCVPESSEAHSTNMKKPSSRFEGSPELVGVYKKGTPGQSTKRIVKKIIEEVLYECNGNCTCGKKPPVTPPVSEAEYQGHAVQLNKPMQGDVKKSKVYVKNEKGNVVKVNFGDKNLSIKKNIPARKRSYCARSGGQGNLSKKTSANYWSRRAWKC